MSKNILIVINVQTIHTPAQNEKNTPIYKDGKPINNEFNPDDNNSIKQMDNIEKLIDQNDLIILTQKFYPLYDNTNPLGLRKFKKAICINNEQSFLTSGITYVKKIFKKTSKNQDELKKNKQLYNTNTLSYLYLTTKYFSEINRLINNESRTTIKCQLYDKQRNITGVISGNKTFVKLNLGEYCNLDSDNAFIYDMSINRTEQTIFDYSVVDNSRNEGKLSIPGYTSTEGHKPIMKTLEKTPITTSFTSTGLWEFITNQPSDIKILNITVVGVNKNNDIIRTIIYGIKLCNIYKETLTSTDINFIYDISGILFNNNDIDIKQFYTSDEEVNNEETIKLLTTYFDKVCEEVCKEIFKDCEITFQVKYEDIDIFTYTFPSSINVLSYYKYIKYKQKYLNLII